MRGRLWQFLGHGIDYFRAAELASSRNSSMESSRSHLKRHPARAQSASARFHLLLRFGLDHSWREETFASSRGRLPDVKTVSNSAAEN